LVTNMIANDKKKCRYIKRRNPFEHHRKQDGAQDELAGLTLVKRTHDLPGRPRAGVAESLEGKITVGQKKNKPPKQC